MFLLWPYFIIEYTLKSQVIWGTVPAPTTIDAPERARKDDLHREVPELQLYDYSNYVIHLIMCSICWCILWCVCVTLSSYHLEEFSKFNLMKSENLLTWVINEYVLVAYFDSNGGEWNIPKPPPPPYHRLNRLSNMTLLLTLVLIVKHSSSRTCLQLLTFWYENIYIIVGGKVNYLCLQSTCPIWNS